MAKIVIYDTSELDREQITPILEATDHNWVFETEKISNENIHQDAEVIAIFVNSTVTREHIEAMPQLKLISCRSTGFNNVDLSAAADHDVVITNVPTYGEATVSEYTFALMLALFRKLHKAIDNEVIALKNLRGHDLHSKTLGVIGTGHIGQRVIAIAKGFEMKVIAADPYPNEEASQRLGFEYVEKDELLKTADVITLHAPYMKATHHLLSKEQFELMQPHTVVINTARGELIDTGDLINALKEKQIAGAALDVIEGEALLNHEEELALLRSEQIPSEMLIHGMEISSLKKMDNVIITPHNAFNTIEAIGRINSTAMQNVIDFWYGHIPNQVKAKSDQRGRLLIARHAESEWNATGLWTGLTDVHLSEKGFHESALLGLELKDLNLKIDKAYCSEQIRSRETLEGMLNAAQMFGIPIETAGAINERDYGEYTGKNKWEMKEQLGEEKFQAVRRGWNEPVPGGETLKDVFERAVPFYKEQVLPELKSGKNVLMVGHGNTIRSMMKYLESISDEGIGEVEMPFGNIMVYDVDDNGVSTNKKEVKIDTRPPNA